MFDSGYLTSSQLDEMVIGARVLDEDGDTLERLPDGRWVVINVPHGADDTVGDVWPSWVLRARRCQTRR